MRRLRIFQELSDIKEKALANQQLANQQLAAKGQSGDDDIEPQILNSLESLNLG